jgi:hypothetical protein
MKYDNKKQLITLTMITLSGFYCTIFHITNVTGVLLKYFFEHTSAEFEHSFIIFLSTVLIIFEPKIIISMCTVNKKLSTLLIHFWAQLLYPPNSEIDEHS